MYNIAILILIIFVLHLLAKVVMHWISENEHTKIIKENTSTQKEFLDTISFIVSELSDSDRTNSSDKKD